MEAVCMALNDTASGSLDKQLIVEARDFIRSNLPPDTSRDEPPVVILYHGDGDGCCAAYLVKQFLNHPARFYWVATPDFDFVKAESFLLQQKPLLTIFLDMPVYNRPQIIEKLGSHGSVFIYDHHHPGICEVCDGKSSLFYINPVIHQRGRAYPTVLFAFELLTEKREFEKQVLFMGLFTETWLDRVFSFEEFSPSQQDRLKEIAMRVHASFLVQDTSTNHYALNFLFKAATVLGTSEDQGEATKEYEILENIYNLIQNEKSWLMHRLKAEIDALVAPKFILKKIDSKMRLCGLIASELRWRYPRLVIGIWQKWRKRFYCELRRGIACDMNLASLIDRIKDEVDLITGGGHPAAAAFTAEGDNFFRALDRIRHHILERERT